MRFYIVRHGQTLWNTERRWQGNQDIPLNEIGMMQAHHISDKLREYDIDIIYSSPLSRASTTAEIIQSKIKKEIIYCGSLSEIRLGEWESHTIPEIKEKHGDLLTEWENNPHSNIGLGVENRINLQSRAWEAVESISDMGHKNVLLVGHGAWIRVLMHKFMDIPLTEKASFEISNCGLSIIDYDRKEKRIAIIELNNVAHLQD